jgi:2-oxoisovalerate dehydrogenase E1 component
MVRTPMGGRRGYGATHSQTLEKHFLGMPGTRVLAINHRFDPYIVYRSLLGSIDRPTLVIENKLLYGASVGTALPVGFVVEQSDEFFPTVRLRPEARPDVTILCYGGMLPEVEKAVDQLFDEEEIVCEVICPMQLYPFNPWPVVQSLQDSRRLVVVEEGLRFAGFGAEAVAQICESAPGSAVRVRRVGPPRQPIPSCGVLEKALLPGVRQVVEAVREVVGA